MMNLYKRLLYIIYIYIYYYFLFFLFFLIIFISFFSPIPVNGGWGSWERVRSWPCSVTCGKPGIQKVLYKRQCSSPVPRRGGRKCVGTSEHIVMEVCKRPCPGTVLLPFSFTSDSNRGNPLPPLHGLLFLISSKGSLICTIPQTG